MYAIKGTTILNGHKNMTPITGKALIVDGEKIVDIVEESEIPASAIVLDYTGKYLMPGLIDLHVHIPANGYPSKKKLDYKSIAKLLKFSLARFVVKRLCRKNAYAELLSGTTTIRAVGGVLDFDTELRNEINAGQVAGPRILAADWAVSVPDGHMTGSVALPAHSAEEAVEMVRELDTHKPDLIKLMITGGVLDAKVPGEPGDLKMPPEYVKAACDEAHKLGYVVAAHVESTEGMMVALENGVDTIEHGGRPTPEAIELLKKTGAKVIATISPVFPFVELDTSDTGFTETDTLNGTALYKAMVELYNKCLDNGIPLGLGTDTGCPYITHYDTWRELTYFVRDCNVPAKFALYTATLGNAKIANIDDITGSIDIGKSADMIVLDSNPLKDLKTLKNPKAVFFRGQKFDPSKLKKNQKLEEIFD